VSAHEIRPIPFVLPNSPISVACPNPHCNCTARLEWFNVHYREEDIYQCVACSRALVAAVGAAAPGCCGKDARHVGKCG
jgi:hypothetical protein